MELSAQERQLLALFRSIRTAEWREVALEGVKAAGKLEADERGTAQRFYIVTDEGSGRP